MLELPESCVLARQLNAVVKGKEICRVTVAQSSHKFAWYSGDPQIYPEKLTGRKLGSSEGRGGWVEIQAGDARLLFSDGINLRYHAGESLRPPKHQLLLEFVDGTALIAVVQMYGGILLAEDGKLDNVYYRAALEKPSPLSDDFSEDYFEKLITSPEVQKLSLKALLATEQRIPGLGNGVLQDILLNAGLHPRKKVGTVTGPERTNLYRSVKATLRDMVEAGGRDTEKDLLGQSGGYITKLSKNSVNKPCPNCGTLIGKEAYLGGSIYYCASCQKN